MKLETVLITGAGGFIASSVIDLLLQKDYFVIAFDNNYKNTCDTLIPFIPDNKFKFVMGDITDREAVARVMAEEEPDFILHAAALVGAPICSKYKALATLVNVEGTRNVVNCSPLKTKLIFCSTGSVYKPGQSKCDENAEVDPPSHYGKTKVLAEEIVLEFPKCIVYRFGTAMGLSKNNIRVNLLANDLTLQSFYNKTITVFEHTYMRSFIHVRDIASAIVFGFENFDKLYKDHKLFNVSNNDLNFTKGELCEKIKTKLNSHVCYADTGVDADQRNYLMDNSRFYSHGWKPSVNMNETLDEIIKAAPILSQWDKYR